MTITITLRGLTELQLRKVLQSLGKTNIQVCIRENESIKERNKRHQKVVNIVKKQSVLITKKELYKQYKNCSRVANKYCYRQFSRILRDLQDSGVLVIEKELNKRKMGLTSYVKYIGD